MLSAICLAAIMLAPPGNAPKVELDFNVMQAGDWQGKRFNEILPADQIKQIGRLREMGFSRDSGAEEQAAYDALLTHLLESTITANDWSLGGNEGPMAELLVLNKDGQILHIEVIGTARVPTAIIVHGKGHGARINVKDFKYPGQKK